MLFRSMMPWVRLHAVKGYLDMIDLVAAQPNVRVSFNFTPVLVRQIHELVSGEVEVLAQVPAFDRMSRDTLVRTASLIDPQGRLLASALA